MSAEDSRPDSAKRTGSNEVTVDCPFCKGRLTIDFETRGIVHQQAPPRKKADFESMLEDAIHGDEKRDQAFKDAFKKENTRTSLLDKKFERAKEDAKKDDSPHRNPLDWD